MLLETYQTWVVFLIDILCVSNLWEKNLNYYEYVNNLSKGGMDTENVVYLHNGILRSY